jgi:hypothetical protein
MAHEPPEPRLTFGVGITGHRPNKLDAAARPRLEQQLHDVMHAIADAVRRNSPGRPLRLVSGFAEGTDQMAVAAAPLEWSVEAILPFRTTEYLKDFEQSAAGDGRDVRNELLASLARALVVTELPTSQTESREQAYLAAGRAMLAHIDVLIAVWDGEEAKPGGTGQIVKEACDTAVPVVWLSPNADREPVLIERFENGAPIVSAKPWTAALSPPGRSTRAGSA